MRPGSGPSIGTSPRLIERSGSGNGARIRTRRPFQHIFWPVFIIFHPFSASILHVSNHISSYFPLESSEGCSTAGGATDREDLQGALLGACAERQGHGPQLGDVVPSQGRRRARPHGISMVFTGSSIYVSRVLKSFSKMLVGFFHVFHLSKSSSIVLFNDFSDANWTPKMGAEDPHCKTTVSFCFSGERKWRMMASGT